MARFFRHFPATKSSRTRSGGAGGTHLAGSPHRFAGLPRLAKRRHYDLTGMCCGRRAFRASDTPLTTQPATQLCEGEPQLLPLKCALRSLARMGYPTSLSKRHYIKKKWSIKQNPKMSFDAIHKHPQQARFKTSFGLSTQATRKAAPIIFY